MVFRPPWPSLKKDLGQVKAQPAATRTPEAEHHPEHVGFVIEKVSFLVCFGHLKGGVRETRSLEPKVGGLARGGLLP